MKKALLFIVMATLVPLLFTPGQAAGEESAPGYYTVADQWEADLLTPEELDDLLAPIALYPDPLIAQVLPAATFVDQIQDAARHVRRYGNTGRIDYQPWDVSVRAVAHYPDLLFMMEREYNWTISLGQAFIEQPQDVMDAVQRLREYARMQGNLYSTREQLVVYEPGIIRIVPARPRYLYLPVYDPYLVYADSYSYPVITFGVGFTIGAWLNRDFDWRQRRVYYHGWRGRGWISRARPHVHDRRGNYIDRRHQVVHVNRRVVQRDTRGYRQQLRSESVRRRDEGKFPTPARLQRPDPGGVERPRPGKIERPRPGKIERPRPGSGEEKRPGRVEQVRPGVSEERRPGRTEEQRPGKIEQPGAGRGEEKRPQRVEPPARGEEKRPEKIEPPAARGGEKRPEKIEPPAAKSEEKRPEKIEPRPGRSGEPRPGRTEKPRPTRVEPQRGSQEPPQAVGQPRRPGREGEMRRREMKQPERPAVVAPPAAKPAPITAPPVSRPAPAPTTAPRVSPLPTPAPPAVAPRTPAPVTRPAPPAAIPEPREVERPVAAPPAREQHPGYGRGRSSDGPSGGRAAPREER